MEEWKDIDGYESLYQISNKGRVKSLERQCRTKNYLRRVPEKIISYCHDTYGYPIVTLHKCGKKKTHTIHKLVAKAFIPNPNNYPSVNHIDENKDNNCVENLEWCTVKYNNAFGTRNERIKRSQQRPILQLDNSGNLIKEWKGMNELCKITGYDQSLISRVCNGKVRHKTAYGYKWSFK